MQVIERSPGLGAYLGKGLAEGFNTGMQTGLGEILKKREKQSAQSQNMMSATSLADQLGLQGDERTQFVNTFGALAPDKQFSAMKNLQEAKLYGQYTSGQGAPKQDNETSPGMIAPSQPMPKRNIAGFDFEEGEIPAPEKPIPPIGPLAQAATIQNQNMIANSNAVNKWAAPYADTSDLAKNFNTAKEISRIIKEGNYKGGFIRDLATAYAEGKESQIAELLKTPDQQKLGSLLRAYIKPKEIGGSNPSTREVLIALASLPSYLKGQEANEYIANTILDKADSDLKKSQLIKGIRKENPNIPFETLQDLVDKKMTMFQEKKDKEFSSKQQILEAKAKIGDTKPMPGNTWIMAPNGEIKQAPTKDLQKWIDAGGILIR